MTRVRHEIVTLLDATLPRYYPDLNIYIQMSGSGRHEFQVQEVCLRDQTSIYRWPPFMIDLGADPTAVLEMVYPLGQVLFWLPGQYEFAIYSGYRQLAVAVIEVRVRS